jgi:hypothetical protein
MKNSIVSFKKLALHTMFHVLMLINNKTIHQKAHHHIVEIGLSLLANASMPIKILG